MHFALSTMHLTLFSAKLSSLSEAMSFISFSPILHTLLGSKPANASLFHYTFQIVAQEYTNFFKKE